jgi:hypothetical protein
MSGRCSPAPGSWISDSPRPGIGMDGSSSVTSTAEPSSSDGSQGSLFTMTSVPSAPTISAPSIVSPAASRAREPQAPGSGLASLILRLRCGPSSSGSFASFDPATCSSRTWRTFSLSMTEPCGVPFSGIWPRSGMTWRGIAFRLPPSALRTAVTGSSPLLPTPMARTQGGTQVSGDSRTGGPMLEEALKLLPSRYSAATALSETVGPASTPSADVPASSAESSCRDGDVSASAIKLLPTPASADGDRASNTYGRGNPTLKGSPSSGASTNPPSTAGSASTGLRLNPLFVEWMMGAPVCGECGRGWTDIDCPHSATAYTSTSAGSSARRSP